MNALLIIEVSALIIIHVLSLVAAGHALLHKQDPRAALGWTVALIFLPALGLIIYLIFGISRAQSQAERIMRHLSHLARRYGPTIKGPRELPQEWGAHAVALSRLGYNIANEDLLGGNEVSPLHNGNDAYPAMIEAIEKAENHVFLSTYIFSYGEVAVKFIKALEDAHKRGVDVRVIVDGIGALYSWRKPWRILSENGVPTVRFRPPSLIPPKFGINLRSHRKLLVCDKVGFTGGMNIADGDVLSSRKSLKKQIQDIQFRIRGPFVEELRRAFLLNWSFCTNSFSPLPPMEDEPCGAAHCRVIIDGPGDDGDALNDVMAGAIDLARSIVRVMTPYFLPTPSLMGALRSAAQRGVDVHIVLPAMNNLPYISWAAQRVLPHLLQTGARVWRQPPPFAHTKLLLVDGIYTMIGSANMDHRSLQLNFEMNTEIFDKQLHDNIASFIDGVIAKSSELTLLDLKEQSLGKKLRDSFVWIFSPYL